MWGERDTWPCCNVPAHASAGAWMGRAAGSARACKQLHVLFHYQLLRAHQAQGSMVAARGQGIRLLFSGSVRAPVHPLLHPRHRLLERWQRLDCRADAREPAEQFA